MTSLLKEMRARHAELMAQLEGLSGRRLTIEEELGELGVCIVALEDLHGTEERAPEGHEFDEFVAPATEPERTPFAEDAIAQADAAMRQQPEDLAEAPDDHPSAPIEEASASDYYETPEPATPEKITFWSKFGKRAKEPA